jgi:hypothetical protein
VGVQPGFSAIAGGTAALFVRKPLPIRRVAPPIDALPEPIAGDLLPLRGQFSQFVRKAEEIYRQKSPIGGGFVRIAGEFYRIAGEAEPIVGELLPLRRGFSPAGARELGVAFRRAPP